MLNSKWILTFCTLKQPGLCSYWTLLVIMFKCKGTFPGCLSSHRFLWWTEKLWICSWFLKADSCWQMKHLTLRKHCYLLIWCKLTGWTLKAAEKIDVLCADFMFWRARLPQAVNLSVRSRLSNCVNFAKGSIKFQSFNNYMRLILIVLISEDCSFQAVNLNPLLCI